MLLKIIRKKTQPLYYEGRVSIFKPVLPQLLFG